MKNILIITTYADEKFANTHLIPDLNSVKDEDFRNAIVAAITCKQFETVKIINGPRDYEHLYCGEKTIYLSGLEYILDTFRIEKLPITVEHIVNLIKE